MRAWLHATLVNAPTVTSLLEAGAAGVLQVRSVTETPRQKPFVAHRVGSPTPLVKDDNLTLAMETPVQVWVHDRPGDYLLIDSILAEIRGVLEVAPAAGSFIQAGWIEDSEDLADPEMGTILRWSRYRLVHRLP